MNEKVNLETTTSNLGVGCIPKRPETGAGELAIHSMQMPENAFIQRQCSSCEEEEQVHRKPMVDFIQAKSTRPGTQAPTAISSQINASIGKGATLPPATRSFMESRFGLDFSRVNIHTGPKAAGMSRDLNAKAFTVGNDIYFNSGEFTPHTREGMHLLAHELTHTKQRKSNEYMLQRQSIYEEVPTVTSGGPDIYSGFVERFEYDNQADYDNRLSNNRASAFHTGHVNVNFNNSNPNQCVLNVPINIQIVNQAAGLTSTCGDISGLNTDPIRPVSQTVFDEAVQNIPALTSGELNNWYSVHLENPQGAGCNHANIPINVVVHNVTTTPDFTITLTANTGRSYVTGDGRRMVLCGGAVTNDSTIIHEMGHAVLGHGDEYHERQGRRPESRERLGEFSRMAQDSPPRLQEFYERHFRFASAFMNAAFPGCVATLSRERSSSVEITPRIFLGGIGGNGGALYYSLGLQLGIPLTEMRRLSLLLGVNSSFLMGAGGEYRDTMALLTGFRAGLNYRNSFGNSSAMFSLSGFGEVGTAYNFDSREGGILPPRQLSAYAEGGGALDLNILSNYMRLGVEGAGGVLDLGGENNAYFRFGAIMGINF